MLGVKLRIESVCLFVGLRGRKEKEMVVDRRDKVTLIRNRIIPYLSRFSVMA